jgi:hypothetical protein
VCADFYIVLPDIMEIGKKILFKFLIVLVTIVCADNGRSFILAGNSIEIILNHHIDKTDEESHQNHLSNLNDDERWVQSDKKKFLSSDISDFLSLSDTENPSGKFSASVWQPPKNI